MELGDELGEEMGYQGSTGHCKDLGFFQGVVLSGMFNPQLGIEPTPPPLGLRSFNLWTTREVPELGLLFCMR